MVQGVKHNNPTPLGVVVGTPLHPTPFALQAKVIQEVEKMLQLGVIQESSSLWCGPLVLVLKPGGSVQFYTDFRKLNKVSTFDAYLMPWVDVLWGRPICYP